MAKVSSKLPEFLQNPKLKNFFDGTVEQAFSKADNEKVTEWIGRKYGTYYNPFKDNYKQESNSLRQNYQLETTATLKDPASLVTTDSIFFNEALDYIVNENGRINNQNRLFGQKYYTYSPPIDYDKFLNYENYYWYPSLDTGVPSVVVSGSTESFTATNGQTDFTLAYAVSNIDEVKVNGTVISTFTATGLTLTINSPSLVAGDTVSVLHKINPDNLTGLKTYTSPNGVTFTSGLLIEFSTGYLSNSSYENKRYFVEGVNSKNGIELVETSSETELFLNEEFLPWDPSENQGTTSTTDGWDASRWDTVPSIENPDYLTIERGCRDKNPWSRTNGWVHKDVITAYKNFQEEVTVFHPFDSVSSAISGWDDGYWDSTTEFQPSIFQLDVNRKGRRPILEFEKDIKLYNYGQRHAQTVDVLETTKTVDDINGNTNFKIDNIELRDGMKILFVNSNFQTDLIQWSGDNYPWDHDSDNNPSTGGGGNTGGDVGWDITGSSFDVSSSIWEVSGVGSSISLSKVSGITIDDFSSVTVKLGAINAGKEYYWTGYEWKLAQQKTSLNQAPLFELYDSKGVALDDTTYSSKNFAGNKIFGYKIGTGTKDSILGFVPHYTNYNAISNYQFENFLNSDTTVDGFKYYKHFDYKNILKDTIEYDLTVNPDYISSGNRIYIENIKQQTLSLQRGNVYRLLMNDSSFGSKGYTKGYHPVLLSTTQDGTHTSGGAVYNTGVKYFLDNSEVTEAVFKSAKFNTATSRYIEIEPTSSTPNTLYYYCHVHSGMGGKVTMLDNPFSTVDQKTETNYYNEWRAVETKSKQKLVQEFETDEYSDKNNFKLDVLVSSDESVSVYINNKLVTDYTIEFGEFIKFTKDLENHQHVLIKYDTNDVDTILTTAYYEVPKNLSNNSQNRDITSYSYSNLLDHFSSGVQNQKNLVGLALGNNTYRDTRKDLNLSTEILQHDAPLLKFMTHVNSDDRNLVKSVRFAQSEYVRFKNKFLQTLEKVDRENDTGSWTGKQLVDNTLKIMNTNKSLSQNWAYSLMASYGDTGSRTVITIDATNKTWNNDKQSMTQNYQAVLSLSGAAGLELTTSYNPVNDKDTKSLYIYKNDVIQLMNVDYVIDNSAGTKIIFIGSNKPVIGDKIQVDYFESKQPAWIPPSPAKLGITKTFIPQEYTDSSYSSGNQSFIQGHDGSLTLKYNNYKDTALLELEKRIYNDIEVKFIDPDYVPLLSYDNVFGNYFNKKDYSYEEYVQTMRAHAYDWGVKNEVEMRLNNTYDASNWKTWNYSSVANISNEPTPGHWRGIFQKFYGTPRPHTHPWEMLGFSIKPTWWDDTYSWTDVDKRDNLINDIEQGIIRIGDRRNDLENKYADRSNVYRHDGFSNYVPVDLQGNLKNPKDIGLITVDPTTEEAKKDWKLGDISPAELAFVIDSAFPFAFMNVLLVTKPAEFCETMFDTLNVDFANVNKKQKYSTLTNKRLNNNVFVHGESTTAGNIVVGYGYNHFVSERLINQNKNVKNIYGEAIRNVNPQLGIKQASYIDFDSYKVQSESYSPESQTSSIFLPTSNAQTFVHSSEAVGKTAYSGVIIEKTSGGYKVHGYDAGANYFNVTESDVNGLKAPVVVGAKPIDVPAYTPGNTLGTGEYVKYEGQIYKSVKDHTTGDKFTPSNYQSVAEAPTEGGQNVTYYRNTVQDSIKVVEYGTEYSSVQDVFDFLINWGRYLEDQGWVFDVQNNRVRETYDWLYSAKEFLFWSLGEWANGSLITLSPLANEVSYLPKKGIVSNVEDIIGNTYAILDRGGLPIDASTTTIIRDGKKITITQDQNVPIYFVNLFTRELEHVTIFDNTTSFGDVIYDPVLAIRQPRLKQTVLRSKDWTGKLEANGHLITATGLVSNFDTSARDIQTYLDVDKTTNNEQLNQAGLHTIGYQSRDHLDNLEIIDENQVRFYQGFVKQKGSKNAIDRLLRSEAVLDNQDINIYEYYAIKLADFGGSDINQSIEVKLGDEEIKTNPQIIQFLPKKDDTVTTDITTDNIITIDVDDKTRWVKKPSGDRNTEELFGSRTESFEMPTAGYVHYNDVNARVFNKTDLNNYYKNNYLTANISDGHLVWVAQDDTTDWNVYRYTQIAQAIESVTSTSPFTVTMNESTKLLTTHGDTIDLILEKSNVSNRSITASTFGDKTVALNLQDQSISKTFTFNDVGGSNADVVAGNVAENVIGITVTTAGSGYSVGDTVQISGSGGTSATGNVTAINGTGGITNVDVISGGSGFFGEPANVTIKTGGVDSAGVGAVLRFKGSNPTYQINTTLSSTAQPFQKGETVTGSVSGMSAKIVNVYTDGSSTILHVNENTQVPVASDIFSGATSGAQSIGTATIFARATQAFGDSTFGALLDLEINDGGTGYNNPSISFSGNTGVAVATLEHSGGTINKAFITDGGSGYRLQLPERADVTITVKDTVSNKDIDFADALLKCDLVSNVVVTINEAFDGTGPAFDLGTTTNTSLFLSSQSLSANATVNPVGQITDRSNTSVRLRFSATNATTGNATVTVNYKKALYTISELDGSNTSVTANDLSGGTHPLFKWKDVRLASRNNGIDQSNVGVNLSATVNDFVSNVCSDVSFTNGDRIFIDNGGDNNWYTMKAVTSTTVRDKYDALASNANVSANITIGSNYWIIDSDTDYSIAVPDQTLFNTTKRKQGYQVNSMLLNRSRIYNDYDGQNEVDLEVFDPIKNMFPGNAIRELSYIRKTDPAVFSNTANTSVKTANDLDVWGENQVGKLWWDLSTVKYIEYENFDNEYRLQNWGTLFPGSTIDVYEWVKSSKVPSSWNLDGTVKSTTDYVVEKETDRQGIETTSYYFWVKSRTEIPSLNERSQSALSVQRLLKNPTSQGLSWYAPVSTSSILVSNVAKFISTDNSVLRINYKTKDLDIPVHKQWLLIKENDPNELVPDTIWNKFTDSLSGKDRLGFAVPDTNLHENMKYGNSIRPRQSWFKDIKEVRRLFKYKANKILSEINLDLEYPGWDSQIATNTLYDKVDFYISGYNSSLIVDRIVDTASEIDTSVLSKNDVIKVNIDNNSKWAIYIYGNRDQILAGQTDVGVDSTETASQTTSGEQTGYTYSTSTQGHQAGHLDDEGIDPATYELVRVATQTSTMRIKDDFWTNDNASQNEIRQIMDALYNKVLPGSYKQSLSELLFECINYVFTEQTNIDWIIKTSYFDVLQNDNSLQQKVSYKPDTFEFVEKYVNEVKPYHGKLLNFLSKKSTATEQADVDMKEQSINMKTDLVFDRVSKNIEVLSSGTVSQQLDALKKRTSLTTVPDASAIDRIAKYYFGSQLASLITTNQDSVDAFMKQLHNIVSPFNDLELDGTPFTINELGNTIGIDKHRYDNDIGWDADVQQKIYRSLFQNKNAWQSGTTYSTKITTNSSGSITSNSYVRYNDISHFATWSASNTYAVDDLVRHNNRLYKCNVAHKNLASETTLQNSRWDLIEDYVYFTAKDHTASNSFATDYNAGNWSLITINFDGAGFVRPQHEDHPQELIPTKVKETLSITAITYEQMAQDKDDIDSDGNTTEQHGYGDQYAFRIFYGADGRSLYQRLPKIAETSLTANIGIDVSELTVSNAAVLWNSLTVPDPDDSSSSIGTIDPVPAGIVNENNPSRIWIGAELIEFTGIRNTNTLTGLRRGVLGTPIYAHTTAEVVRSASVQHDIPNASKNARWSAFDPVGTTLIDKTEQSTWDMTSWDNDDAPWDKATLDPSEQAIFIRAGSISNFNLYNTTYAKPGYATPQSGTTGYFSEE